MIRTQSWKKVKNDFEKKNFKLLNNALFGKFMENVRIHRDSKFVNTEDIYVNIAKDAEAKLYTSNYDLDKPLPKGKYKKAIGLMKNKLCGK